MKNVLRWVIVLPAAVVAYLISYAAMKGIAHFILLIPQGNSSTWIHDYSLPLIASIVSGYCYIYGGVWVAPRHKLKTATRLLIIGMLYLLFALFTVVRTHHWITAIEIVGNIIGMFGARYKVKEEQHFIVA
jgi:hypothetical protein